MEHEYNDNNNVGQILSKHTDSILCCSIDQTGRFVVSGGVDDKGYVWDLEKNEVKFECTGHTDSVLACGFSIKSTYVATADMDGLLQVWDVKSGENVFNYEVDDINFILWHNKSDKVILAGTVTGDVYMWNISDTAAFKSFQSHGHAATVARLFSDGIRLAVGYSDGTLKIFDLKTNQQLLCVNDVDKSEITSMDVNPSESLVAIGYISSVTKMINAYSGKIIGTLQCCVLEQKPNSEKIKEVEEKGESEEEGEEEFEEGGVEEFEDGDGDEVEFEEGGEDELEEDSDEIDVHEETLSEDGEKLESIESVSFSLCGNFLCTSSVGGEIYIWDVPTRIARYRVKLENGITRSCWHKGNFITTGLDGSIRIFDTNLKEIRSVKESKEPILDFCKNDHVLITASDDNLCRVFKLTDLLN